MEKKPLYHFYPGSSIFSIGTWGCNLACSFCQNWSIAQETPPTVELSPAKAVSSAVGAGGRCIGIAYTYSEPAVWYEYVRDTATLAKEQGLKNVLVTNGFINPEPLKELLGVVDALNIDVKAFSDKFYREVCGGKLKPVKKTVELAASVAHVEITCLVIPGVNDSTEEIGALAQWLRAINPDIPLHLSRYFPNYKLALPPTPVATLENAYNIARQYLNYVYLGNLGGGHGSNTYCPTCGNLVIDRQYGHCFLTQDKKCSQCGSSLYLTGGIFF